MKTRKDFLLAKITGHIDHLNTMTPTSKDCRMNNQIPSVSEILAKEKNLFGKSTVIIAIMLILLGAGGLILPVVLSVLTDGIIAAILIIAGVAWLFHSYKLHQHHLGDWLRPLLLLVTGVIMVTLPSVGIASIGLMFIFYFVLDAYRNFTQSGSYAGHGRGWFMVSGILDIIIALFFLVTWPQGSLFLVGIFVGVNLIFDGIILLILRKSILSAAGQKTAML
jgi:uncharacterized membrane protein HdeD (DUF308 family)